MAYYVIGAGDQKYGPADIATLNAWIRENRLNPDSVLEDESTGVREPAKMVQGLLFQVGTQPMAPPAVAMPPSAQQPAYTSYPRQMAPAKPDISNVLWAIGMAAGALLITIVSRGFSYIWLPFSFWYAYKAIKDDENKLGWIAVGISAINIVLIIAKFAAAK